MTLAELIAQVNEVKPNSFGNSKLTEFVNELEADVVDFLDEGSGRTNWTPYVYSTHNSRELVVKPPYDRLYKYYLMAKIDYALEEYQSYTNNQEQFASDFADYKDYAVRNGLVSVRLPGRIINLF